MRNILILVVLGCMVVLSGCSFGGVDGTVTPYNTPSSSPTASTYVAPHAFTIDGTTETPDPDIKRHTVEITNNGTDSVTLDITVSRDISREREITTVFEQTVIIPEGKTVIFLLPEKDVYEFKLEFANTTEYYRIVESEFDCNGHTHFVDITTSGIQSEMVLSTGLACVDDSTETPPPTGPLTRTPTDSATPYCTGPGCD